MKINKKFLQFIAALMILYFHLGILICGIDTFIAKTGYIGVDIFFFISAYSLSDKQIDYAGLLKNRFFSVYLKFLIFVLIAAIYKGMSVIRIVKILTFVEFFEKGGGSFLWFVPAIMLFYLAYPLYVKWNNKYKSVIVLVAWFVISIILNNVLGYTDIFIFTNRLPIIIAGYELKRRDIPKWVPWVCLPVGIVLIYQFGYMRRLNVPFTDFYFVIGMILTIAICGISGYIKSSKVWDILGKATLELYCIQMIFGVKYASWLYRIVGNKVLTNAIMVITMFAMSIMIALALNTCMRRLENVKG